MDGNLEKNPLKVLLNYLETGEYHVFASTVMPGPQLKQAIPFTKEIRKKYPHVKVAWGGYFPSNHSNACINSPYVDYLIYGPGRRGVSTIDGCHCNSVFHGPHPEFDF
ncbi:MAG: hypothetical protein WDN26_04160 [Chitinophagaceae bacterium]